MAIEKHFIFGAKQTVTEETDGALHSEYVLSANAEADLHPHVKKERLNTTNILS